MTLFAPDFRYRFYLDGTLISNPLGWDEIITTIKRDRELKGVFVNMDVTFTFQNDGYDHLKDLYDASNYCAESILYIEQSRDAGDNYSPFFNGIIKISDVTFEYKNETAQTKVLDNSFFAKIDTRKNNEAVPIAGKSINDVTIPIPPVYTVEMFEPQTGNVVTPGAGDYTGKFFKTYDLFRYMVAYMTDDEVDFDSTLFGVGGELEYTMMTFGKVIRRAQAGYIAADFKNDIPVLTFKKLFQELDRKINLGIFIDNSGGKPILRIEKWDDLFKTTVSQQIPNIDVLKEKISDKDIYSILKLGSNKILESAGALQFPELIKFIGFNSETYTIVGKCNVDQTLDLTGDFIVSSNIIEQILIADTGDESYDKDWFIVDSEFTGGMIKAKKTNWLIPSSIVRYYNEYYTNENVAERYLKAVPNNIAKFLGNADNKFQATQTSDKTFVQLDAVPNPTFGNAQYDDDSTPPNFDTGGNYNNTLFEYVVPQSGLYVFEAENKIATTQIFPPPFVSIYLMIHDSIGNVKQAILNPQDTGKSVFVIVNIQGGIQKSTWTAIVDSGDKVSVQMVGINGNQSNYSLLAGSLFKATNTVTGGGVYKTFDPSDYPIIKDTFEIEMDSWRFDPIVADTLQLIEFSRLPSDFIKGWIDEIRYDHKKQKGTFNLLSSKNSR